jgi:hypothetical protein
LTIDFFEYFVWGGTLGKKGKQGQRPFFSPEKKTKSKCSIVKTWLFFLTKGKVKNKVLTIENLDLVFFGPSKKISYSKKFLAENFPLVQTMTNN